MLKGHVKNLIIIASLITAGFLLQLTGLLDAEKILLVAREYADHWWLVVILILLQIILFTFALAGSLIFWVAAPLYPPVVSTLIVAVGATLGGVSAYYFSSSITDEWIKKIENSHAYRILHKEDNFFTLFALRIFPAFPHSLVNYSSGILKVKLSHFIAAAFIGVGIKSYVYADIIYNLADQASVKDLLNFWTIAPLVLIAAITLFGVFIKYKLSHKDK